MSVTLRWDEVNTSLDPAAWTVLTIERRLARLRTDPWARYWKLRQRLTPAAIAALRHCELSPVRDPGSGIRDPLRMDSSNRAKLVAGGRALRFAVPSLRSRFVQ